MKSRLACHNKRINTRVLSLIIAAIYTTNPQAELNNGSELIIEGDDSRVLLSPISGLSEVQQTQRRRGQAFFNTLFISGESEVPLRQGLGPLFNGASCEVCHNRLGRGQMPSPNNMRPIALTFQLSALNEHQQWQRFHPVYGEVFNPFSIDGIPDEGKIKIKYDIIKGQFADGTPWQLFNPTYEFTDLNYGSFDHKETLKTVASPRLAQSLIGMGLLTAIPEQALLENVDTDDDNQDGISGRAHYFQHGKQLRLGRFGWKATHATLRDQITDALKNEQGIKTSDHPIANCTQHQAACLKADAKSQQIELSDADLNAIVFFTKTIPVPRPKNNALRQVQQGQRIFNSLSCQQCHIPAFMTQKTNFPLLSQQKIAPYTDLLLHDMGEGLADQGPTRNAQAREWRTAPLWGIGLNKTISGSESYLHDGRAKTLTQAILWHDGEAAKAKQAFLALNKEARLNLLVFLKSL